MALCSANCKKALKSSDCKAAGWSKEMTSKVLKNCKTLDEAKESAKKKGNADPRVQKATQESQEAEKKRKYAEGCRDMLSYECGVGGADQDMAMKLLCTPRCTSAINSVMCKEAGITEEKINRKALCGDIDPKTKKPKTDSAQPLLCQKGLNDVCGIDTEAARNNPESFGEDSLIVDALCSKECVELVNSPHCKAMKLDPSMNSPENCAKFRCRMDHSDEMACEADMCGETCKLTRPECKSMALEVGLTDVQLAECSFKRGEITEAEFDAIKMVTFGEAGAPKYDPSCIEHTACKGGDALCNSDCPMGTLTCAGTRRILGIKPRPWEVQCTAEQYGPKSCEGDEFDVAAQQVADECGIEERKGPTWMEDSTDTLCSNVFLEDGDVNRPSPCTTLAQEKLLGYTMKCMLDEKRQGKMADGGLMYKHENKATAGLVNLFFFECPKNYTGNVWMQDPGYVLPYKAPSERPKDDDGDGDDDDDEELDSGFDEDLSKDADDELDSEFEMEERSTGQDWDDSEDPMENEDFKMRYELGELTDDELMQLSDDDLTEYLATGDNPGGDKKKKKKETTGKEEL